MKRLFLVMVALFMGATISYSQSYVRNGKEYSSVVKKKAKSEEKKTGYTWKDSKGKTYDIYMSSKGSCYIIRTSSKTGKEYKSYLPKDVSEEIGRELGIRK